MIHFDAAHRAVHYPADRRFRLWIRPSFLYALIALILLPLVAAWCQRAFAGLPLIPDIPVLNNEDVTGPHGFPWWIRYGHFFNFLFLTMLIRSGLSIVMEHPRLYFNNGCTPGTEWLRFTPLKVPTDRVWTAKDDSRYISPLVALPGYRRGVGIARSWHFLNVYGFVVTGVIFISMLFLTPQWRRLVPTSGLVFTQAWSTFVDYANFHFPPEPDGYYGYNALQQLTYFAMVFVMGPLSILTGLAMSPALVNRYAWFPRLFGGRQGARSIHFCLMVGYVLFIVAHVALVAATGFARNMNHIVLGTDDVKQLGMILGFGGIAIVVACWVVAHHISWSSPRMLQHMQRRISLPLMRATLNRMRPRALYRRDQISPYFWPNGQMPVREDWKRMALTGFREYRLKIGGLVERPVELSLADLEALGTAEFITMHHCIQGWSGIAQWRGVPMQAIVHLVKPLSTARTVAFFSFGGALYNDTYYDTQALDNVLKPECILAIDMNGAALSEVHGAPLRLRVENQLGYKMVKWLERIEFIESEKLLGEGEGGRNEDDEYFDLLPNI